MTAPEAHGVTRSAVLPDAPESPSLARRLVTEALEQAGREDWVEPATLAVSELVTNAVLHAHTRIELTVRVEADGARVEVRDFCTRLPTQRTYDEQATTGRGMCLVATLVSEHGVTPTEDGKVVWFVVDDAAQQQSEEALLSAWADSEWDLQGLDDLVGPADDAPAGPTREVVLLDTPATLWLAARQHHDALLRELVLYQAEHEGLQVDLAAADVARTLVSSAVDAAVEQAQREGQARPGLPEGHPSPLPWTPERLDLRLAVEAQAGPGFAALQDALDAAERLAVDGRLLARPGLPEVVAVRDWVCEQVQSQLLDVPPRTWPGTAQARFETAVHARDDEPDWDVQEALASGRGVVAADDANRIVGISGPLAAALGWVPEDLLGRRVVTLIPPQLREAHVAGFTRHLTSGEAHVLGVPLTLPVLHADGSEVTCRFLVEQAASSRGRALYLAWIEPVDAQA